MCDFEHEINSFFNCVLQVCWWVKSLGKLLEVLKKIVITIVKNCEMETTPGLRPQRQGALKLGQPGQQLGGTS